MSFGYVATVLVLSGCTLCALRPLRRPGPVGVGVYLVGMVYNELPVLAIVAGILSTASTVAEADLGTLAGVAAATLPVPALAGLTWVLVRSLPAAGAADRAMAHALGRQWRTHIDTRYAAGLRSRVPLAKVLLVPFLRHRHDVERIADLPYGDAGRRHRLDLYRHRSHPTGCPVLVHFHRGHFVSGAKNRESLALLHRLASRGWLCISANYRLRPQAGYPDYVVDAKRVLAWVRRHGPGYGADASVVFVAGNSAGAYLATFAALTENQPAYQPGFADADTSVTAAVGLYGYYGRTDAHRPSSSPQAHLHADAPPVLLLHGDRDSIVPVDWARDFARAWADVSRHPVVYTELPGAQHSFDYFDSLRGRVAVDQIEAFAAWVRSRPARSPRRAGGHAADRRTSPDSPGPEGGSADAPQSQEGSPR